MLLRDLRSWQRVACLLLALPALGAGQQLQTPEKEPPPAAGSNPIAPQRVGLHSRETIVLRDDTAVWLKSEQEISSQTAVVGQVVHFKVAHNVRLDGLVVVPRGTPVQAKVIEAVPARRRHGGKLRFELMPMSIPAGVTINLRDHPAPPPPKSTGHKVGDTAADVTAAAVGTLMYAPYIVPFLLAAPFMKGDEVVIPADGAVVAFVQSDSSVERQQLLKLQPPPYSGPPVVYYSNTALYHRALFCGEQTLGPVASLAKFILPPGSYIFNTGRKKDSVVEVRVEKDKQYWIERGKGGLKLVDFEPRQDAAVELTWQETDFRDASPAVRQALTSSPLLH